MTSNVPSGTPIKMAVLTAQGITLEPLAEAHAPEMFEILSDPAIYQFENQPPRSLPALAERYGRLQQRQSPDGSEIWLNWVIRLESLELCGYVQATLRSDCSALIAYELASRFWNRGIGSGAVAAMLQHLDDTYQIQQFLAVFKSGNFRSRALLRSLGFQQLGHQSQLSLEPDEEVMFRGKAAGTTIG